MVAPYPVGPVMRSFPGRLELALAGLDRRAHRDKDDEALAQLRPFASTARRALPHSVQRHLEVSKCADYPASEFFFRSSRFSR
jgi:hypothetical protein